MRKIIVQDENDEENNTEFINESIINIISKHSKIYTYEDIFLYECDMIDLINTRNINFSLEEETKLEAHLEIHQEFILDSIHNYTQNLIKKLVNNITEHYKKTLLTEPYNFENIPQQNRYIEYNNNKRLIINTIHNNKIQYEYKKYRWDTDEEDNLTDTDEEYDLTDTDDDYDFKEFTTTITTIKIHDKNGNKENIKTENKNGEYFTITNENYYNNYMNSSLYSCNDIHARTILHKLYEEKIAHLKWFYYNTQIEYNKNGYDLIDNTTLLYIFITNRTLKTITKHIKFYNQVKEFKRRVAIDKILRSKIYNYGLGLQLNIINSGLTLLNAV